ncbi:4'-phosphopantetheinyl transferase family protein [Micromonospora parathelypteridis]|uniref:4'-phosphopantetheinyl transferase EntD n=1 Tax=Micromonospora parathelypteridis TaxID=1839617 RepID=A0A840VU65_9ACTN|nr:4'-phosphopantetheinyl transferase superfamily protein [Micromonospora parathelypteridis]MBB5476110.1 4'-phosphopantetheinyl transferase EntD [Micromonospora parathelypteridis]GGO32749.1 4'-phosphopantetheinyl transferase [Micromonospora parathelypteridis]
MIENLLPAGTSVSETFRDLDDEAVFPGEEAAVAQAVESRRREFVTARRCAREALAGLGVAPTPIVPGPRREPTWPTGVVGSITHCAGYRGAAVAARTSLASLGIDAEPHAALPTGVLDAVTLPAERRRLAELTERLPATCWDRLLFSAKESVYKAWYPLTHRMLGFDEAELTVDAAAGVFTARLLVPGTRVDGALALTGFTGRWLIKDDLILTAVTVEA